MDSFSVALLLLSIMSGKYAQVAACISHSLLSIAAYYSIIWMYAIEFVIHSSDDGLLGCVQYWAIMSNVLLTVLYKC